MHTPTSSAISTPDNGANAQAISCILMHERFHNVVLPVDSLVTMQLTSL